MTSTLDGQADIQQNPMSPMAPTQTSQPSSQAPSNEMPTMIEPMVGVQSQIVDPMNPYRRSGNKFYLMFYFSSFHDLSIQLF